jgi:hypothetical protein
MNEIFIIILITILLLLLSSFWKQTVRLYFLTAIHEKHARLQNSAVLNWQGTCRCFLVLKWGCVYLSQLSACFPLRRPGINPRSSHVRFVVEKSGTGAGFLREFRFPLSIIIPSISTHLLIILSLTLPSLANVDNKTSAHVLNKTIIEYELQGTRK